MTVGYYYSLYLYNIDSYISTVEFEEFWGELSVCEFVNLWSIKVHIWVWSEANVIFILLIKQNENLFSWVQIVQ